MKINFNGRFDGQGHEIANIYINRNQRDIGLIGYGSVIVNLGITGTIKGEASYAGGLAGEAFIVLNCYNKANINNTKIQYSTVVGTAGIVGMIRQKISYCYNEGDITYLGYGGGIVGYDDSSQKQSFENCYNKGNVISQNGKAGGGIIGYLPYDHHAIRNCYNVGNVSGSVAGPIVGKLNYEDIKNVINNCLYPSNLEVTGNTVNEYGTCVTDMKSMQAYNMLNSNGVWLYVEGSTPILANPATINPSTEISIINVKKKLVITSEVGINSENARTGGDISGTYNDTYLENNNIKYVETVPYGDNNTQSITITPTPTSPYKISKITINGKEVKDFTLNATTGVATIPVGYFQNMTENKHIVVVFEKNVSNIIVHHYKKGTTTKLAKDENYTGKVGDNYTTSPNSDINDYELEKDSNGDYVIPSNAKGTFATTTKTVKYYYDRMPVKLTVHHYKAGTTEELAPTEGPTTYDSGSEYSTNPSSELLQNYNLVDSIGQTSGIITEDTVVDYYYAIKGVYTVIYDKGDHGTFTNQTKSNLDYGIDTPGFTGNKTGQPGYTFIGWKEEGTEDIIQDATITSTPVTKNTKYIAQWEPDTNTNYKVEYYYENENGSYPSTPNSGVTRQGTTDTLVMVTEDDKTPKLTNARYVFDTTRISDLSGTVKGNGSLILKVYFKRLYTVTYQPGEHGTFENQSKNDYYYDNPTLTFEGEKTGEPGYEFTGWIESGSSDLMSDSDIAETTVTRDKTYIAQWEPSTDTKYTIEFYYQNEGIYEETPNYSQERTGTTGAVAEATEDDKTPNNSIAPAPTTDIYIFDESADNILSGTIKGDGTLVLKVYFKLQDKTQYNIDIIKKDTDDGDINSAKFVVYRETDKIFDDIVNTNIEIKEREILADEYTYYITETQTAGNKYENVLFGRYIKLKLKSYTNGEVEILENKVYTGDIKDEDKSSHQEFTDDKVLEYIKVIPTSINNVYTLNVEIVNPVKYKVDIITKDTANNFLDKTNVVAYRSTTQKYSDEAKDNFVEISETMVDAGTYEYFFTQTSTKNDRYVNVLDGKFVKVTYSVSANGTLSVSKTEIYQGSIGNGTPTLLEEDDAAYEFVKVVAVPGNNIDTLQVTIIDPVTFKVELEKVDTDSDGAPLENTGITIESEIIADQEAVHNNEIETEAVTSISEEGVVTGETNEDGQVKYEETWVKANENTTDFYTYKIRETATSGEQYVNVLDGYVVIARVHVDGNGTITLVDENGIAYDANEKFKYTIEKDDSTHEVIAKTDALYGYVSVEINKNAISTTIDTTSTTNDEKPDSVDIEIKNPVKYQVDIITKDTLDNFLTSTNVVAYRVDGNNNIELYKNAATNIAEIGTAEITESPMDAGRYTYYFTQTGRKDDSYVNVLDGKFIKATITVAGDGKITVDSVELYKGTIGEASATLITDDQASVFKYFYIDVDSTGDIDTLQVTIINPVTFKVEVDMIDSEEHPLGNTDIEISSEILKGQNGEFDNEKVSGIKSFSNGTVEGNTTEVKDGEEKYATVSYEETWVNANKEAKPYYTYEIRETKKAGNQYVNILEGYKVVVRTKVGADGKLTLVDENGDSYENEEPYKYTIEAEDGTEIPEDKYEELCSYVTVMVNNGVIKTILNTQIENPVRYNVAVHATVYGQEQIELPGLPIEIAGFSPKDTYITDLKGNITVQESPVRADDYEYRITPLDEFVNGSGTTVKLSDEFINIFDGYYIGVNLRVHGNGSLNTISKNSEETTQDYKLYKRNDDGEFEEINFEDTIVDEFVKVKVTKDEDEESEDKDVYTLNVYVQIPEKYNFKLIKTDIDIHKRLDGVEFSITVKDSNGNVVLKDARNVVNSENIFETINTNGLKTANISDEHGIIELNDILIEKAGTYTFEITETTPKAKEFIYKEKSEPVSVRVEIIAENGKYVVKNMNVVTGARYTNSANTKITGDETKTVNVNVLNERIKGSYDLITDTINKATEELLDGGVYKITVKDEDGKEIELYLSDGDITSHNPLLPYEGDVNGDMEGTSELEIDDIRIDLPGTYTIIIEELKSPDGFTKLDDVIEITVTTGIKGEFDNAKYVVKDAVLKDGNHGLVTVSHTDDNIKVIVRKEYFDLALRQYISSVNGKEIEGRNPSVVLEKLKSFASTTAEYNQKKTAQSAYIGNEIIYTIEVYNEGLIDGYAEEITQHLPAGLEFVNDDFNKAFGWEFYPDDNKVVTTKLSKANDSNNMNLLKAFEKTSTKLDSRTVQLKLRVKDNVKPHSKLTTIAEITKVLAEDRKQTLERDSRRLVVVPTGEELANYKDELLENAYIPGDEDDDDFEKLIVEEFDLAVVKYVKQVNDKTLKDVEPEISLNEELADQYEEGIYTSFKYKPQREIEKVNQNDTVIYGIRVYNEGSVAGYATEVIDTLPEGLVLAKNSEINKKYGWTMIDKDGEATENRAEAVGVASTYIAEELIKPLVIENDELKSDFKELEIEFTVEEIESKDTKNAKKRTIENIANVSKYTDENHFEVEDIDPEEKLPENREKIYVKIFDLELTQEINSIIVQDANGEQLANLDLSKSDNQRKIAKVDIPKNKLEGSTMKVEYVITIKNNGETNGYATEIKDYVPEGFIFRKEDNPLWKESNGVLTTTQLADVLLKPGESKQIKLVLIWNKSDSLGSKENIAEISKHADEHKRNIKDIDSTPNNKISGEDDQDSTVVIIAIRTGKVKIVAFSISIICIILAIGFAFKYYKDNK